MLGPGDEPVRQVGAHLNQGQVGEAGLGELPGRRHMPVSVRAARNDFGDGILADLAGCGVKRPGIGQLGQDVPAAHGVPPQLGARGPGLSREELSHGLERSRTLNADATRELFERLEAEGLIRGDTHVDLTPEGEALHRSLREYIAGPAVRLLGQFDLHDIETTVRTLQAITKRAAEESSGSAS